MIRLKNILLESKVGHLTEKPKKKAKKTGNPALLGCQLLGEVVGGKVAKSKPAEIGIMDINFSNEKDEDKLFSKFPNTIKSLQWHSYEVQGIESNKDVTLLASSQSLSIKSLNIKTMLMEFNFI